MMLHITDKTFMLEWLISAPRLSRDVVERSDSLIAEGADPFRTMETRFGRAKSAFDRLLCRFDRLQIRQRTHSADSQMLSNWPLCQTNTVLFRQTVDIRDTDDFVTLVEHFLAVLPEESRSLEVLDFFFHENLPAIQQNLIPEQCFPFISNVFRKMCSLARNLNRQNPEENSMLQNMRDVFPRMLLELLHRTVLVQNRFVPHSQRIRDSADSLHSLLFQTNLILRSVLTINPLNSATRETLDNQSRLSKLFSITVRTVYFTAGYASVLGIVRRSTLFSDLVLLVRKIWRHCEPARRSVTSAAFSLAE